MVQAATPSTFGSSRLVRLLMQWDVSGARLSQRSFTEQMGRLIDLSHSISISALHGSKKPTDFTPGFGTASSVREDFDRAQKALVRGIIGKTSAERVTPGDETTPREHYQKQYQARQGDLEFKVRQLHERIRDEVAQLSGPLGRLCALDETMAAALSAHNRKFFGTCSRLLGRRVEDLYGAHEPDQAHLRAASAMRDLLLAEAEARLLPTLGLIEALDEQEGKGSDD